jgi:chromate reductase
MAYKIAIIVGSLREGSINRKVARSICALRGDNLDCTMTEIGDLPLYNQDLDADPPEQWVRFRQQVGAADGVLFVKTDPGTRAFQNAINVGLGPTAKACSTKRGVVT